MKTTVWILGVYSVLATLLIITLHLRVRDIQAHLDAAKDTSNQNVEVFDLQTDQAPSMGSSDAMFEIVVFSDFECQACGEGFAAIDRLMDEYPGHIRKVYKHLPLSYHPNAESAAASMAAHVQGKFWEMHEQLTLRREDLGDEAYRDAATTIGLDMAAFEQDRQLANWRDYLNAELSEAHAAKVLGAPTYFVNGVKLAGTDYASIKQMMFKLNPGAAF